MITQSVSPTPSSFFSPSSQPHFPTPTPTSTSSSSSTSSSATASHAAGEGTFTYLFTSGDFIQEHTIGSASTFAAVVFLLIVFDKTFHYFREHNSVYVRMLVARVMSELQSVGMITLMITFLSEALQNLHFLPEFWLPFFEWVHMVIFVMLVLFAVNTILIGLIIQYTTRKWLRMEVEWEQGRLDVTHPTTGYTLFWKCRRLFLMKTQPEQHHDNHKEDKHQHHPLRFSPHMSKQMRAIVVEFTEVTMGCWWSVIVAAAINSLRSNLFHHFVTAGIPVREYNSTQRLYNMVWFVGLFGWGPMFFSCAVFWRLGKKFEQFLETEDIHDRDRIHEYYLFGSRAITLNCLRYPFFLLYFYMAFYLFSNVYELAFIVEETHYIPPMIFFVCIPLWVCPILLPFNMLRLGVLTHFATHNHHNSSSTNHHNNDNHTVVIKNNTPSQEEVPDPCEATMGTCGGDTGDTDPFQLDLSAEQELELMELGDFPVTASSLEGLEQYLIKRRVSEIDASLHRNTSWKELL